jgi:DNA-binding MarR family transcriptional regulator
VTRRDDLREIEQSLSRISRIGRGREAARLRAERSGIDLSRPGISILAALNSRGPLRASALAEVTDSAMPLISRELRTLTAQGYVTSSADPDDGRARIVTLTRHGAAAYRRYRATIDDIIDLTFDGWDDDELAHLAVLLQRVALDFTRPTAGSADG